MQQSTVILHFFYFRKTPSAYSEDTTSFEKNQSTPFPVFYYSFRFYNINTVILLSVNREIKCSIFYSVLQTCVTYDYDLTARFVSRCRTFYSVLMYDVISILNSGNTQRAHVLRFDVFDEFSEIKC